MVDLPRLFRKDSAAQPAVAAARQIRVGVVQGALEGPGRMASIAALFPHVRFETVGANWPDADPDRDVLLVALAGSASADVEDAVRRLRSRPPRTAVVVILRDADVTTTRWLIREGAADVLTAPLSEPALALSLERLLSGGSHSTTPARTGQVVALLKAGGGVGATSLGVQVAAMLAARAEGDICFADLDLQFGDAALHLDLPDAVTITDCLGAGALGEVPFAAALSRHGSGLRLLAAPREVVALESMSVSQAEALVAGLRRNFGLTIVDLPASWTAWTNHLLSLADRIVLVTQLSVPHVQLTRRQFQFLRSQNLADKPVTLVCNGRAADRSSLVSLGAAQKALDRVFDVVVPEDRRTMMAAAAQGVEISAIRRGAKVEKAVAELAARIAAPLAVASGR
ncbi:MAG: hypothetical protein EPO51_10385 [Phenylobacterium sp.]|uniref:AAA family ATPase n=1 Tax=Phenylobacterium sp. TaxID=1871053 RepID=UPI0012185C92|nr:hypothetical protein [Phenylobacterium sp.]TAJ72495.1 MAG: hypothetical protein EPO51_10385 [Phenylobacterium sp.]